MELKRLIIFLAFIAYHSPTFSQSQMGVVHDNINVTEGIRLNPARAVDPKPWLDMHLGGLYMFGTSNGAYLAAEEFSPLSGKFPSQLSQNFNIDQVDGQIEGFLLGPAFNISLGKFSLGLSSAFRNYAIGRNIPLEFTRGLIYGLQISEYYGTRLNGGNYRTKALSFMEVGLNGGMIAHQKGKILVNVGVNFKYMLGIGGIDFLVDDFSYEMTDSTNAFVYNYTGKYAGADIGFHPGVGYGADLGVTIEKKVTQARHYTPHSPQSNCKYIDYVYRLGFSILDIGAIKFKSSYYREVSEANGEWVDYAATRGSNIDAIINTMDQAFQSGITDSKSTYSAMLPLTFSLQFDYNFGDGLFINSTLMYGVPLKRAFGGERLSMLAITPRYEGKHFGISLPLSMNTIMKPAAGLALRFWYLTVGTDNISSYLINTDVYRLDLYAHLKVPIFVNKPCKKRGLGEYDWHFSDCSAPGARNPRKKSKRY